MFHAKGRGDAKKSWGCTPRENDHAQRFCLLWRAFMHEAMPCFKPDVRSVLQAAGHGEIIAPIDRHFDELFERRVAFVHYPARQEMLDNARAKANCEVLRQTLLHRAERLLISLGSMISDNNVYGLALIIRGHMEATATLGNFCHRIASFQAGNIDFDTFQFDVAHAVLGARHEFFREAPSPTNILTCIERSDRFLATYEGFDRSSRIIADPYEWVSEFCHPNFLSHAVAIEVDKANNRFVFRHDRDMRKIEQQMLGYADISSSLFILLFDAFRVRSESGVFNCLGQS